MGGVSEDEEGVSDEGVRSREVGVSDEVRVRVKV